MFFLSSEEIKDKQPDLNICLDGQTCQLENEMVEAHAGVLEGPECDCQSPGAEIKPSRRGHQRGRWRNVAAPLSYMTLLLLSSAHIHLLLSGSEEITI